MKGSKGGIKKRDRKLEKTEKGEEKRIK